MAKRGLLNDTTIRNWWTPKPLHDGDGLYFFVTKKQSRSWIYRYELNKRTRHMGLGPYPEVSLKEARFKHDEAKKLRDSGIDPIDARKAAKQIASNALTVKDACEGLPDGAAGEVSDRASRQADAAAPA